MYTIGAILRKILEIFISSVLLVEWELPNLEKKYVVKHIESDYPREKYQVDTTYLANYILNDSNI